MSSFLHPCGGRFAERYERNNKKGGFKALKCFPQCTVPKADHGKGTVCQDSVFVTLPEAAHTALGWDCSSPGRNIFRSRFERRAVEPKAFFQGPDVEKVIGVCRIATVDRAEMNFDEYLKGLNVYTVGEKYSHESILQHVRTQDDPLKPEVLGILRPGEQAMEFYSRGWHYGWFGGRYKIHQKHQFEVYFFIAVPGELGLYECVDQIFGTPFEVFSSRRANPDDKIKRRISSKQDEKEQNDSEEASSSSGASSVSPKMSNGIGGPFDHADLDQMESENRKRSLDDQDSESESQPKRAKLKEERSEALVLESPPHLASSAQPPAPQQINNRLLPEMSVLPQMGHTSVPFWGPGLSYPTSEFASPFSLNPLLGFPSSLENSRAILSLLSLRAGHRVEPMLVSQGHRPAVSNFIPTPPI